MDATALSFVGMSEESPNYGKVFHHRCHWGFGKAGVEYIRTLSEYLYLCSVKSFVFWRTDSWDTEVSLWRWPPPLPSSRRGAQRRSSTVSVAASEYWSHRAHKQLRRVPSSSIEPKVTVPHKGQGDRPHAYGWQTLHLFRRRMQMHEPLSRLPLPLFSASTLPDFTWNQFHLLVAEWRFMQNHCTSPQPDPLLRHSRLSDLPAPWSPFRFSLCRHLGKLTTAQLNPRPAERCCSLLCGRSTNALFRRRCAPHVLLAAAQSAQYPICLPLSSYAGGVEVECLAPWRVNKNNGCYEAASCEFHSQERSPEKEILFEFCVEPRMRGHIVLIIHKRDTFPWMHFSADVVSVFTV